MTETQWQWSSLPDIDRLRMAHLHPLYGHDVPHAPLALKPGGCVPLVVDPRRDPGDWHVAAAPTTLREILAQREIEAQDLCLLWCHGADMVPSIAADDGFCAVLTATLRCLARAWSPALLETFAWPTTVVAAPAHTMIAVAGLIPRAALWHLVARYPGHRLAQLHDACGVLPGGMRLRPLLLLSNDTFLERHGPVYARVFGDARPGLSQEDQWRWLAHNEQWEPGRVEAYDPVRLGQQWRRQDRRRSLTRRASLDYYPRLHSRDFYPAHDLVEPADAPSAAEVLRRARRGTRELAGSTPTSDRPRRERGCPTGMEVPWSRLAEVEFDAGHLHPCYEHDIARTPVLVSRGVGGDLTLPLSVDPARDPGEWDVWAGSTATLAEALASVGVACDQLCLVFCHGMHMLASAAARARFRAVLPATVLGVSRAWSPALMDTLAWPTTVIPDADGSMIAVAGLIPRADLHALAAAHRGHRLVRLDDAWGALPGGLRVRPHLLLADRVMVAPSGRPALASVFPGTAHGLRQGDLWATLAGRLRWRRPPWAAGWDYERLGREWRRRGAAERLRALAEAGSSPSFRPAHALVDPGSMPAAGDALREARERLEDAQ